jgi:tetratricopeptide (TPR) repeat protein
MSKQSKEATQEDIDNYTEAIWLNPRDSDAYYFRGNAKNDLGDIQGAIEDYTEVIRLEPSHTPAYFFSWVSESKVGKLSGSR